MLETTLSLILFIITLLSIRFFIIANYKIGYYETKLKNRSVDIEHVEKISLLKILTS